LGHDIHRWKDLFKGYKLFSLHFQNRLDLKNIWVTKVLRQYESQFWDSHLGVLEKNFNLAQVINKCWTLWPSIRCKPEKHIPSNLGAQFATLKTDVLAFINVLTLIFSQLLINWGQLGENEQKRTKIVKTSTF